MKLGTSVASLVFFGTACGVVPGAKRETASVSPQAVSGTAAERGSDADGALFRASLGASVHGGEGAPPGSPCGPSRCKIGQFCCNESCGLCVPRGGLCSQRECGLAIVAQAECLDDSGCRLFSSYCDGCQCLPGGALDPEPSCHATVVACILDPCHHQQAACVEGACTIMPDGSSPTF